MNNHLLHTPEGVRDIYGTEFKQKLFLEEKLHNKAISYGYEDIQTPTFEFFDVFSKEIGTTSSKELYKFFDKEGDTLVLRPDFTPSIARCAAKYFMEENVPLRFCYTGNTFTNTNNLQGKLKEVTQTGSELIGDDSVEADAEMINLVIESLKNCGLQKFQISVGQVEYFKGLCEEAGISEDTELKLKEYISAKNVFAAQDLLLQSNVSSTISEYILNTTNMFGDISILNKSKESIHNERSLHAVERLQKLYEVCKLYGTESYVSFDLGMLSKYRYYTGIIFKAFTYGVGDAIVKGGRYDTLLNHFGKNAPAIGFAVVVDDLLVAMKQQKTNIELNQQKAILEYNEDTYAEVLKKAQTMRNKGWAIELRRKDMQE